MWELESDKPIIVQTVGGNGLNDWATVLLPMPENDDSGNTDDCLNDADEDGIVDANDNCVDTPNADQADADGDSVGNVCDNCATTENPLQADSDDNGIGDACEGADVDTDDDGVVDSEDKLPHGPQL